MRFFRDTIYEQYRQHAREFPWRQTRDPYHILVSDIMLQQTQTDRVAPKYLAFIARFPTVSALANASLRDVLIQWQGLGYNRRGQALWRSAHYAKQSPFFTSNRRIRGLIIKELVTRQRLSSSEIIKKLAVDSKTIQSNLVQLKQEGLISKHGRFYYIV